MVVWQQFLKAKLRNGEEHRQLDTESRTRGTWTNRMVLSQSCQTK